MEVGMHPGQNVIPYHSLLCGLCGVASAESTILFPRFCKIPWSALQRLLFFLFLSFPILAKPRPKNQTRATLLPCWDTNWVWLDSSRAIVAYREAAQADETARWTMPPVTRTWSKLFNTGLKKLGAHATVQCKLSEILALLKDYQYQLDSNDSDVICAYVVSRVSSAEIRYLGDVLGCCVTRLAQSKLPRWEGPRTPYLWQEYLEWDKIARRRETSFCESAFQDTQ